MTAIDTAKNTDQVELNAFQNGYAPISDGLTDEEISGEIEELLDTGPDGSEEWAVRATYDDTEQGSIKAEIENRTDLLDTYYPFELRNSSLYYQNSHNQVLKIYECLLLISLTSNKKGRHWQTLNNSFEELSGSVVEKFFQCTWTWWTGANSKLNFQQIIEEIFKKTEELEWIPDFKAIGNPNKIKDAGIDFISYRRMVDKRVGGLFFFGQSACGGNWIHKTTTDLRASKYKRIFREPYAEPVKIFVIPHLLNNSVMVKAKSDLSGLIFDRATLTRIVVDFANTDSETDEIRNFCKLVGKDFS